MPPTMTTNADTRTKPAATLSPGTSAKAAGGKLDKLRQVQAQAEQRVKLGMQLFKAAEARLAAQHDVLAEVKAQQSELRESIQNDVAASLQTYDQWMGKIDESFTGAIRDLTARLDQLESSFESRINQMERFAAHAQSLLDQAQKLTDQTGEPALIDDTNNTSTPPLPPFPKLSLTQVEPAESADEDPLEDDFADDQAVFLRVLEQLRDDDGPRAA